MKFKNLIYVVPLLALLAFGCENVDEPFSIDDGAVPAFVLIDTEDQAVTAGSSLEVDFELGQTQGENVTVSYSISGDAVEGEDYILPQGAGSSITIEFDSTSTNLDASTLLISFPQEAALGTVRELTFTLESAVLENGDELTLGRGGRGISRTFEINGLQDTIQEGNYDYTLSGDFAGEEGTFVISKPAQPVTVGGSSYFFTISNIAGSIFGQDIPYAFNITASGSVVGAPNSQAFETVILDVGGSYAEGQDQTDISFEVTFQCCGVAGAQILVNGVRGNS
jgi:hypothetical protein